LLRSVIRDSAKFSEIGGLYYEQGFNAACLDVVKYLKNVKEAGALRITQTDLVTAVHTYFGSLQSYILMNSVISGIRMKFSSEQYLDLATNLFLNGIKQF
jgi:hypothetical protein